MLSLEYHCLGSKNTGYGNHGLSLKQALIEKGVKVNPDYNAGLVLYVAVPTHVGAWQKNQKLLCYTMWETDTLPKEFSTPLKSFDYVIVPCKHNQRLFEKYGIETEVVNEGIDPKRFYFKKRKKNPFFTFLHIATSKQERKGTDLLVKAFRENFTGKPARLIVKAREPFFSSSQIQAISTKLSPEEIVDLYRRADCYVAPSRGEGFGLTPLEAMATGCPTILSDNTGHSEFAHLGFPIKTASMNKAGYFIFGDAGKWCEPDYNELVDKMNWVYSNYDKALRKAEASADYIAKNLTWYNTAERIIKLFGDDMTKVPTISQDQMVKPSINYYPVLIKKKLKCDIAGKTWHFKKGDIEKVPFDVRRILYESGYAAKSGTCPICGEESDDLGTHLDNHSEVVDPQKVETGEEPEIKVKTSKECRVKFLKILIGAKNFSELHGCPIYLYNLSKELIDRGHQVTIAAESIGGEITAKAEEAGVEVFKIDDNFSDNYDLLLLNQPQSRVLLDRFPTSPAYNIIHSPRTEDEPIEDCYQIRKYLYVKKEDKEYIKDKVPTGKIDRLPIPVDTKRFKKSKYKTKGKYLIVAPCTLDQFRLPMFKSLIERAEKEDIEVLIKGRDYGTLDDFDLPQNVKIESESFDIENTIKKADEVASMFEGTVAIEAWAMGKKVSIYKPDGSYRVRGKPPYFSIYKKKNVCNRLLGYLEEKEADIIVPHHDQAELLSQLLKSIPLKGFNVFVARGGSYAENCNLGIKTAQTKNLIFANDDMVLNPQILWEMVDRKQDIVGGLQYLPSQEIYCAGIFINNFGNYEMTKSVDKADYPSGGIYRIKKSVFKELGGLCEEYINGAEDQDLFLNALERGKSVGFTENGVIHYVSQSTDRFKHQSRNDEILKNRWPNKRLERVLGKDLEKGNI